VLTAPRSALEHATHTHTVRVVSAPFELPAVQIAAYWDASRSDDPRVLWILESVRQSLGQEQV
jgi:DNA-binding transcriptional LysR family regulator